MDQPIYQNQQKREDLAEAVRLLSDLEIIEVYDNLNKAQSNIMKSVKKLYMQGLKI